jgi:hypothetical protein
LTAWVVKNKTGILAVIIVIALYTVCAANFPGLTEAVMYAAAGWYWLGGVLVPWIEAQLQKLLG